jgi:hypothetical protein
MKDSWSWEFLEFGSGEEPHPVLDWMAALPPAHKFEMLFLLNTMSVATRSQWRRPEFDPLGGAGGISEIRVPDVRDDSGIFFYRIYGFFGPDKRQYCFLHGNSKEEKNDTEGKSIAKQRLDAISAGHATAHKFVIA